MRRMASALHVPQLYGAALRSTGHGSLSGDLPGFCRQLSENRLGSPCVVYTSLDCDSILFETVLTSPENMGGNMIGQQPEIVAGGGPRTFPGGVSKWQWKRMQEKKQKEGERKELMREREIFEAKRREQLRLLNGVERPWEEAKRVEKDLSPIQVAQAVPEAVMARHVKPNAAEDLWNDRDGPVTFTRPDGRPSNRSLPPDAVHSTRRYHRSAGPAEEERVAAPPGAKRLRQSSTTFRPEGFLQKLRESDRGRSSAEASGRVRARGMATSAAVSVEEEVEEEVEDGEGRLESGGSGADPTFMSETRFDSFPLSPLSLRAVVEGLGYATCTRVQAATLPPILAGRDVIAKAKTGSGKTIAFLLPSIEKILKSPRPPSSSSRPNRAPAPSPIHVLAIAPARELATQVAAEGSQLLTFHSGLGAQKVIGGTKISAEVARLSKLPCQILVGTPGRLLDHIQTTPGMKERLQGVKVLILDECDQLLQMGFRKTLEGILRAVPPSRQTLLFSATMPKEVMDMAHVALRGDHVFVDAVGEESGDTNTQVGQEVVIAPLDTQLPVINKLLTEHMREEKDFKVLVFATTARQTQLYAELFRALGVHALEIHSRKSQSQRTKTSDAFRTSPGRVVMFTSDVSARGVDYPNVTLVLQVGVPSGREQYVHRLGRTGRGGKEGKGVVLLAPWEEHFLKTVKDLPIKARKTPEVDHADVMEVEGGLRKVSDDTKSKAYQAWLGYYKGVKGIKWDNVGLVKEANRFSTIIGLDQPPVLLKKVVGMMGLRGVPGLRVQ